MVSKSKDVLELLKSDAEYYGGVGKEYLSNSDIYTLLREPDKFGMAKDETKEMLVGRYFHAYILEPEKAKEYLVAPVSSRNSKAYKEFCADHLIPSALLKPEQEQVHEWADKMLSMFEFSELIKGKDITYEEPSIAQIKGEMWKGKADIINPNGFAIKVHDPYSSTYQWIEFPDGAVIDLKTSSDVQKFYQSVRTYNYDSQGYIYRELFGKPILFLVIDKRTLQLAMHPLSEVSYDRGEEKVERATEIYKRYYGKNATENVKLHFISSII